MHMKPSPEQQKSIQLQMLMHLKQQFKQNKDLFEQFQSLEENLKNEKISSDEAAIGMRTLQQKVLQIKMNQVLEQQQKMIEQEENIKKQSETGKGKKKYAEMVK